MQFKLLVIIYSIINSSGEEKKLLDERLIMQPLTHIEVWYPPSILAEDCDAWDPEDLLHLSLDKILLAIQYMTAQTFPADVKEIFVMFLASIEVDTWFQQILRAEKKHYEKNKTTIRSVELTIRRYSEVSQKNLPTI